MWTDDKLYPNEYLLLRDGEYILTALSKDGKQIISSEPFFIRTYLEPVVIIAPWSEPPIPPPAPDFHKEYNEIQTFVDKEAEFPGGHKSLMSYLSNNLVIPLEVLENKLEGRVFVRFVIEKDGSVSNATIAKVISDCFYCNREAIALVKAMPKWKPAYSKRYSSEYAEKTEELIPVRSYFILPITFKNSNYPILPQGYDTLKTYLSSNLIYPKRALKEKIEGKVYVKLLFAETGEMKDVILLKGMENCPECDEEAIRLMKSVPKEIMKANNEYNSPKPFFFNTYLEFKAE